MKDFILVFLICLLAFIYLCNLYESITMAFTIIRGNEKNKISLIIQLILIFIFTPMFEPLLKGHLILKKYRKEHKAVKQFKKFKKPKE